MLHILPQTNELIRHFVARPVSTVVRLDVTQKDANCCGLSLDVLTLVVDSTKPTR